MTSLQMLSASSNPFHGSIPDSIGATHKYLRYFAISNCSISGTIPPSFYNLSQLHKVGLAFNQLQGTLPLDIGVNLPKLTEFIISENFFHGKLPVSLANLTHLVIFGVSSNNFIGNMFSGRNMPNLAILEIAHNKLGTGKANDLDFLQTLVNCSNLQELECGDNNFGGMLPDSLGNLSTTITSLDFQQNKIYGSIPSGLFNLINLRILDLESNQLSGHISSQIEKLTKLYTFDIHKNYFTGKLPFSLGNLSLLSVLYADNNRFEGSIPASLGNCTNLVHLALLQNNLRGAIPPQLFHTSSMLVDLLLAGNQLKGTIPAEIGQLNNLVNLGVSKNALSGEFPTTLSSCTSLVTFSVRGNLFTGSIPPSFKSLTSLNFVDLSHNKLSGTIPQFLANFSLFLLDLSCNNFEGEVPKNGVFANQTGLIILGNSKLCGGIPELHLPTCPPSPTTKRKRGKLSVAMNVIIAVASLIVAVSIVSFVYFLLRSRRKQNKLSRGSELNLVEPFSKVSYDILLKATDRFSEANLLGAGRFGSVFKGVLVMQV